MANLEIKGCPSKLESRSNLALAAGFPLEKQGRQIEQESGTLMRILGTHFAWNSYTAVYSSLFHCTLVVTLTSCLYCTADQ